MGYEQVLIIGLDGVDFRYLDEFMEDLPNITTIREEGVESPLASIHPPWTGSAWPSMYTGLDPSYHGVYDFFDYRNTYPDEADIVSRNDVEAPAIWNYLSEVGLKSIVFNVPVTHPAEQIDGVVVPGYLAPADEEGHPSDIRDELSDDLGDQYRIYAASETEDEVETTVDGYVDLIRHRTDAAEYLLDSYDWEFSFVQVQKTDAVFHNFSTKDEFRRVFEATDDMVGRLTDLVDDQTTVLLVSDHGMGPTTGQKVYLNDILKNHGYVKTKSDPTNLSLSDVKGGSTESSGTIPVVERVGDTLERFGVGPRKAYQIAERLGIEQQILDLLPGSVTQSLAEGVDWRRSQAYCRRTSEQGIRINLAGRDGEGVVPADEYESLRSELVELLSELETEHGKQVFESVRPREEVYDGPHADHACDILFRTTEMNHEISTNIHGRTMRSITSHNHKQHGIFIAQGPAINSDWNGSQISLVDIAPVVFSALRRPIPERMMGTVPADLLSTAVERDSYDDVASSGEGSYSQDRSEVTDRLGDLGYL